MSPENDRDSQRFKLLHFATCFHRAGSLKKPYFRTEWVGVAGSDVIGAQRVGLLLVWNSFSFVIPAEHNNLAKTTQKCLWCSRSQSLMVLRYYAKFHLWGRTEIDLGLVMCAFLNAKVHCKCTTLLPMKPGNK